jgi:hypothetical protein
MLQFYVDTSFVKKTFEMMIFRFFALALAAVIPIISAADPVIDLAVDM